MTCHVISNIKSKKFSDTKKFPKPHIIAKSIAANFYTFFHTKQISFEPENSFNQMLLVSMWHLFEFHLLSKTSDSKCLIIQMFNDSKL